MKSVEFCYWLQGFFELDNSQSLNVKQTKLIRQHLAMVFKHEIDPSYPAEQQEALAAIHAGKVKPPKIGGGPTSTGGNGGLGNDFLIRC